MTPSVFLGSLLVLTAAAVMLDRLRRRQRSSSLRALAGGWRMNYTPIDSLQIRSKVIENFPIPGASALHVRDLVYGIEGDRYRYVFTAEYTLGVMRGHRRHVRVGTFCEPRSRYATEGCSPVLLAAESGGLLQQYQELAPKGAAPVEVRRAAGATPPASESSALSVIRPSGEAH